MWTFRVFFRGRGKALKTFHTPIAYIKTFQTPIAYIKTFQTPIAYIETSQALIAYVKTFRHPLHTPLHFRPLANCFVLS